MTDKRGSLVTRIGRHAVAVFFVVICLGTGAAGAAGERLAVSSPVANIRSGPGSNYDVIWQVERYHPLVVVEKKGKWYRFRDFEKDEGWIHRSLVKKIPSVITVNRQCNIRSGPGTKNEILFTTEKGIPFKVLKRKGSWIHIEHADGDKGWIYKTLVW